MDPQLAFLINNLIIPIAGMGTAIILGVSVLKTIRHYIDRRLPHSEGEGSVHLEELRHRLDELERGTGRLDELEDRLDFAERLLTRGRESKQDAR